MSEKDIIKDIRSLVVIRSALEKLAKDEEKIFSSLKKKYGALPALGNREALISVMKENLADTVIKNS